MGLASRQRRLLLNPEPVQAPSVPYKNRKKRNPTLPGWAVVVAAFLLEWLGFFRRYIWRNAGFGSLRDIREYLDQTEARFNPSVIPFEPIEPEAKHDDGKDVGGVSPRAAPNSQERPSPDPGLTLGLYSVSDYHSLYLSGELTPLAVARAILPKIRRDTTPPGEYSVGWIDVKVNLVIEAATDATQRYHEKRSLGLLDGVMVAIKDEYDVAGYPTTLGSANENTRTIADHDSWCVQKLREAGAVILGKATMVEYGMDTSGNNTTFGTPLNPYNQQYYCGGSSCGSAFAVSSGVVPVAMGSDAGGSVRIPASFCSVLGLKPSHGRLSFAPHTNHASTCAVKGPLAGDISSLNALYKVVGQPHPTSPFAMLPMREQGSIDDAECSIIGIPEAWCKRATPAIQEIFHGVVEKLAANKSYTVVLIEIPFVEEGRIAHAITMLTDASTVLPDTRSISAPIRAMLALGRATPSTDYLLAQKLRAVLMNHLAWLWKTYPGMVIVTPTTACAGWPIRKASELKYGISDGNRTEESMEYVWMANFCGVPSISLPAGFVVPEGQPHEGEIAELDTVGKIPVGLMATAEWGNEAALMKFGSDVDLCAGRPSRAPSWLDVIELARQEMGSEATP